jgi:hypothetical protein
MLRSMRFFSVLHTLPFALPYILGTRFVTGFSTLSIPTKFVPPSRFHPEREITIKHFSPASTMQGLYRRHLLHAAGRCARRAVSPLITTACSTSSSAGEGLLNLQISTVMGLESLVKQELTDLGYPQAIARNGRVELCAGPDAVARCNIGLRTATRVLIKVAEFPASTFDELFDGVQACQPPRSLLVLVIMYPACCLDKPHLSIRHAIRNPSTPLITSISSKRGRQSSFSCVAAAAFKAPRKRSRLISFRGGGSRRTGPTSSTAAPHSP